MSQRDISAAITEALSDHRRVGEEAAEVIERGLLSVIPVCVASLRRSGPHRGKLLTFGNGGSAADAQHIATELTVRFTRNRRALPAIALTTDTSALTAIGNDFGFEELFARQVEALCRKGDVVIGISTSGNSENVVRGLAKAKELGATTVALGGGDGGRMVEFADHAILVPSTHTARIQEMHILIGHILVGAIEEQLQLDQ